jgi:hypothetical protein
MIFERRANAKWLQSALQQSLGALAIAENAK